MSEKVTAVEPRMIGWKWHGTTESFEEERPIIKENIDHLVAFKEFCDASINPPEHWQHQIGDQPFEEYDFYALSLGFFIARGIEWPTAFSLATMSRYNFQYWC